MSNVWRFKIDIRDELIFQKLGKNMGVEFPKELSSLILENNAASPDKNRIIIKDIERVLDSLLSFNETEIDAMTFNSAFQAVDNNLLIPFAMDPFGNFFCYMLDKNMVGYYDHEEQIIEETEYSLKQFIKNLY